MYLPTKLGELGSQLFCSFELMEGESEHAPAPQGPRKKWDPLMGLADTWEKCDVIRRRLAWDGQMCHWLLPRATGVPSYQAASLNYDSLKPLFETWSKATSVPRTLTLPRVKKQALC